MSISGMDWDDLCELEEALDRILGTRELERKHGLEGVDADSLAELQREVTDALDKMQAEEEQALEAEYWRSVL